MIQAIIFDFSRVLLHPKDQKYTGKLNDLNRKNAGENPLAPYDFFSYFLLNDTLLAEAKKLKTQAGMKIYIFTTDIIQERKEVKEKIAGIVHETFTARELLAADPALGTLHTLKANPNAYLSIAKKIQIDPKNILFIDDTVQNIAAAKTAGLVTIQFPVGMPIERANKEVIAEIATRIAL